MSLIDSLRSQTALSRDHHTCFLTRPSHNTSAKSGRKLLQHQHCSPHHPCFDGRVLQHRITARAAEPSQAESSVALPELTAYADAEVLPVRSPDGSLGSFPGAPAIYGILDVSEQLQYIGLSRKLSATLEGYAKDVPDLTHFVKFVSPQVNSREQMIECWKLWMQQAVQETGKIPPGNDRSNQTWTPKRKVKPDIKLTPGKGLQDLTVSMTDLIDQVVKSNKVVAFVKGTRTEPQCGFSYKVLSMLNELGADYEVLNVLDETYNPTLRETIKEYSQWPTIPQLYVDGELVGGADILEEMHNKGELKELLKP